MCGYKKEYEYLILIFFVVIVFNFSNNNVCHLQSLTA